MFYEIFFFFFCIVGFVHSSGLMLYFCICTKRTHIFKSNVFNSMYTYTLEQRQVVEAKDHTLIVYIIVLMLTVISQLQARTAAILVASTVFIHLSLLNLKQSNHHRSHAHFMQPSTKY